MQSELKPCPFCGSDNICPSSWDIQCQDCKAMMPGEPEDASSRWNRRALTAALSEQERALEVKKLEWEAREDNSHRGSSTIGYYHIFPGTGFSYDLCGPVGGRLATYKRLSEAKATAQADYEQRIRSALADEPVAIPTANCCVCGRIIDTREKSAGGDDHGDETAPGKWTCSIQCYDAFTGYVEEPAAWYREESFTCSFSRGPIRPKNATSNPDEWKPLYAHALPSGTGDNDTVERVSTEAAMSQWERSLKRPDLSEKDRVLGAIEAYKRQAFAFAMLSSTRTASSADGSATGTSGTGGGSCD